MLSPVQGTKKVLLNLCYATPVVNNAPSFSKLHWQAGEAGCEAQGQISDTTTSAPRQRPSEPHSSLGKHFMLLYAGLPLQAAALDSEDKEGDLIMNTHLSSVHLHRDRVSELLIATRYYKGISPNANIV